MVSVIDYLLTNEKDQARLDSKDKCYGTALFYAIKFLHWEAAKYLIDRGSEVNIVTSRGNTPLIVSTLSPKGEAVTKLLLENRATVYSENNKGETPMLNSIRCGSVQMVKVLLQQKSKINHRNKNGVTPLMEATKHNNIKIMRILLDRKAALELVNKNNETLYSMRSRMIVVKLLSFLTEKGANLHHKNKNSHTPLTIAKAKTALNVMRYLEQNPSETV